MKRILVWFALLVLIGYGSSGGSIGTPNVSTLSWLNIPFEATDTTTGVGRIPDSVSVVTFFGNCTNAGIFQVSSASLDSNWWDSTQTGTGTAGSKIYYFRAPVADIDADSGAGLYTGVINAWFQGYPMPSYFSFYLLDGDLNALLMTMEPKTNRKNVYVKVDSSATNDGTSWGNACSIHKAIDYCTGAAEYFIYVGAGTYKDVEITDSIGHTHWIGAGVDETKLWGVVEPNPSLAAKHLLRLQASYDDGAYSDTSSVEVTGFEFRGYEATSGVEDSATLYALKINEPTSGFYVHDNVFYNFLRPIFICSQTRHGRIEDNWIGKPIKYGVEICGGFEHRIRNNVIDSLLDGRVGVYVSAAQGQIVYSENIINAAGGRAFHFTAASKRGVVVNNFVRAVAADSAFEDLGTNTFMANHIQSQISDPQTIEEDIASRLAPTTAGRTVDVTANGEVGLNLDNTSGDYEYGDFNGAGSFWNEGKAGYTVSLNSAQAGSLNSIASNVDGIKVKTDSSSYGASGLIKSTPQTDVTVDGASVGAIVIANWAAGTRTLTVADWSTHSAPDVVNEWETQSQADPTGFRVNVLEIEGVDATEQINAEADQALNDYDPPTRTEATADKDAVIVEVNENETKIDALNDLSVAEVWAYATRVLTDTAGLSGLMVVVIDTTNLSGLNVFVIDTTNLSVLTNQIETSVGTNTDPASMSSSLFAGQQYIADNMSGGTSGCGAGIFACTLEVRDSSLQAGIHNVKITVRNHDQTATTVWGWTNPDGKIFFFLDSLQTDNSYKLWVSSLDYNFTYPETLDLRSDTTAVYYGTAFDYGAPPADSSCAVIGQVFNTLVDSLSGVIVTFTLVAPDDSLIVYNGAIFSKYEVSDTTDASGRFRLDMLPEAVFDRPAGMLYYKATIDYPVDWGGMVVEFDSVSVPIATSVDADEILH